jgi:PAS domain S-box-containing protein
MSARPKILIADSSLADLERLREVLGAPSGEFFVSAVDSVSQLLRSLKVEVYTAVVCDAALPGLDIQSFLEHVRRYQVDMPVVLLAEEIKVEDAVAAMKLGVSDYIKKSPENVACLPARLAALMHRNALSSPREASPAGSDLRFRALIAHCHDGVVLLGSEGNVYFANPSTTRILGYPVATFEEMQFYLLLHPEDRAFLREQVRRCLDRPGESTSLAYRIRHQEGAWVWVEGTFTNLLNEPAVRALAMQFRDIGLRRQREIALRESEARLRLALEAARMVTWDWDRASNQLVWSGNCAGLFGLDPWNFRGQLEDIRKHMRSDEYRRLIRAALMTLKQHGDLHHEFPVLWPDGSTHWLAAEGKGVYQPGGKPWRMRGIVMDVTEKILADLERREYSQRLRTLSHQLLDAQEKERRRLAHELHDELGQSLSAIKINLQVLRNAPAADVHASLADLIAIVDQTIQQTRQVALELRPSMLDDFGLVQTLRWYLDRLEKTTGLQIARTFPEDGLRWPGTIETTCFRIA